MSANKVIRFLVILGVLGIAVYFISQMGASDREYAQLLQKERKEKDRTFKEGSNSPIPKAERPGFSGLSYYEPVSELKFRVEYEKLPQPERVDMPKTGNDTEPYLKYARVNLELEGKPHSLYLYQRLTGSGSQPFFLPFTDLTNGYETYGGGRYLDVEVNGPSQVEIDFNKAYSPYCAYDHSYSCPIPPKENHLPVAIKAGEKNK